MRALVLVVPVLASTLASSVDAQAPDPDQDSPARIHHDAAERFYELGDYERAIEEWQAAYRLSGLPEMLFNLYSVHERAGDLVAAESYLSRYLGSDAEIGNRNALETRLASLRERIGQRAAPSQTEPDSSNSSNGSATAGWIVLGVGVALGASTAIFGGLAASEYASLDDRCGGSCTADDTSSLSMLNTTADLSLVLALAAGTTGVVLIALGGSGEEASATVSLGPGRLDVGGSF